MITNPIILSSGSSSIESGPRLVEVETFAELDDLVISEGRIGTVLISEPNGIVFPVPYVIGVGIDSTGTSYIGDVPGYTIYTDAGQWIFYIENGEGEKVVELTRENESLASGWSARYFTIQMEN